MNFLGILLILTCNAIVFGFNQRKHDPADPAMIGHKVVDFHGKYGHGTISPIRAHRRVKYGYDKLKVRSHPGLFSVSVNDFPHDPHASLHDGHYGEGATLIFGSDSFDTHDDHGGYGDNGYDDHQSGYDDHQSGYDDHQSGYEDHQSGYDDHQSGYDDHQSGYDSHQSGYDEHQSGYDSHQSGYDDHQNGHSDHQSGYDDHQSGYDDDHQSGYDDNKNGHLVHQSGYDDHQSGYNDDHQSGYDDHQSGYDDHQSGYDDHQSGYDDHQDSNEDHQGGYDDHGSAYGKDSKYERIKIFSKPKHFGSKFTALAHGGSSGYSPYVPPPKYKSKRKNSYKKKDPLLNAKEQVHIFY